MHSYSDGRIHDSHWGQELHCIGWPAASNQHAQGPLTLQNSKINSVQVCALRAEEQSVNHDGAVTVRPVILPLTALTGTPCAVTWVQHC
jgi:hypothetical protein